MTRCGLGLGECRTNGSLLGNCKSMDIWSGKMRLCRGEVLRISVTTGGETLRGNLDWRMLPLHGSIKMSTWFYFDMHLNTTRNSIHLRKQGTLKLKKSDITDLKRCGYCILVRENERCLRIYAEVANRSDGLRFFLGRMTCFRWKAHLAIEASDPILRCSFVKKDNFFWEAMRKGILMTEMDSFYVGGV